MEILKGTEIRMSDGSTKPIEELVVGDKVMTNRQGTKGIYTGNITNITTVGKKLVQRSDTVKVTLNGEGEMINLELSDEVIKEEKGIIVDLIRAAHSNAKNQLKSKTSDEISKATGGFGISGFKWPL